MKTQQGTPKKLLSWLSTFGLLLATGGALFVVGVGNATSHSVLAASEGEDIPRGNVLPPQVKPDGYSLSAIAKTIAFFNSNVTGLPPDLPCLAEAEDCVPIQMLSTTSATNNTFVVSPGTILYVPVFFDDDTPPIIGSCTSLRATTCADFPDVGDREALLHYIYSAKEFGLRYSEIIVDGKVHELGSDYLVEVKVPVPPGLNDAFYTDLPTGTRYITSAAFVGPLSVGKHTVAISGNANGQDLTEVFNGIGFPIPFPFTITYTVTVQ